MLDLRHMKKIFISLALLIITAVPAMAQMNTNRLENRLEKREEQVVAQQQKRAEFQEKIKALKNQNKAKIAEKINNQLVQINQKATQAFERHLNTIQNLLNKIIVWKDKLKTSGKDVTAAETAISQAQTAIDTAKPAVEAQKQKTYAIEFTDESDLRIGASTAKTNLRTDLKAVREKVKAARQAVVDSLKTIKQLYPKVSIQPSPSSSTEE